MTGWAYPPKDYAKWEELVYEWVKHCVERYGKTEVEQWYWEVWNEANGHYWKAKPEQYTELEKTGKLGESSSAEQIKMKENGVGFVTFKLPRRAVTLLVIEP